MLKLVISCTPAGMILTPVVSTTNGSNLPVVLAVIVVSSGPLVPNVCKISPDIVVVVSVVVVEVIIEVVVAHKFCPSDVVKVIGITLLEGT